MSRSFEQALTHGQAQWITSAVHDPAASRLVVSLTHDVAQLKARRVIEFGGIQAIEHRWTHREDNCAEGLLGAEEDAHDGRYRYLLVTDQREIEFIANYRASIKDV